MNTKYLNIHNDERGSAILLTLGILSLLLTMAMVFAVTSRNARSMALSTADGESAELAAESAADRAVSIMYYIGKEGDKPTVVDNGRETMEYNSVPYIGSNDCSDVPMLKQTELVRHTAGGNQPKQNILYLFGKEDQIRNAGGTFDAGSILHNEV
ncbi:MAG: hypothetical protein J6S21_06340, partial [Victivallales bacterium]|nr:hypothetical protein [Victivallales bacterium]